MESGLIFKCNRVGFCSIRENIRASLVKVCMARANKP